MIVISEELLDEIYEVLSCVNDTKAKYDFIEDWSELKGKELGLHIAYTVKDLYEIIETCKYAIKTIEKVGDENEYN